MCRFTLYLGPPIRLSTLLIEPDHSLIRQSTHSHEREEPLNGDGFGVGWYAREFTEDPAVFRSITPAWNNRNLQNLARVISSHCVLAHVRAATQSSGVNEANCHPFRFGKYLCMHNGDIGNFRKVRRKLLELVSDEAFNNVYGSTDSEHFFALVISELSKFATVGAMEMALALDRAISKVTRLVEEMGEGEQNYLNVAITDGVNAVVSRYTSDPEDVPESLYFFTDQLYESCDTDQLGMNSVVVSSECLSTATTWQPVPANHLIIMNRDMAPMLVPCGEMERKRAA